MHESKIPKLITASQRPKHAAPIESDNDSGTDPELILEDKPIPRTRTSIGNLFTDDLSSSELSSPPVHRSQSSYSNSSSGGGHRKSVSFDLDAKEYTPVYMMEQEQVKVNKSKYSIEDRLRSSKNEYYRNPSYQSVYQSQENQERQRQGDIFTYPEKYTEYNRMSDTGSYERQQQKRGILRSPSPMTDYPILRSQQQSHSHHYYQSPPPPPPLTTLSRKDVDVGEDMSDKEIERDNPFRKEFLSKEDLHRIDTENAAIYSNVIKRNSAENARYSRPQSVHDSYERPPSVLTPREQIYLSNDNLLDSSASNPAGIKRIPIKIGNLNTPMILRKPPLPPAKPQLPIKHADLVRNEGLEMLEPNQGFIEYEHHADTNTITIARPAPPPPITPLSAEVFPDIPLPPVPPVQSPNRTRFGRNQSVERPTLPPPPPPPINKLLSSNPPPPPPQMKIEIVPAKFDVLPIARKPEYIHGSLGGSILVSEEMHRNILLQENEIRNSRNSGIYSSDRESITITDQYFIPQNEYSPTKVLPVQYSQLPRPQQPGYYQKVPANTEKLIFNYPPQSAFTAYGRQQQPLGSYLVSDNNNQNNETTATTNVNNNQQSSSTNKNRSQTSSDGVTSRQGNRGSFSSFGKQTSI